MDKPQNLGLKKVYLSPKLTVYGTVKELTKKTGFHGTRDNGRFAIFRTHV
jgi:hypothetical protein